MLSVVIFLGVLFAQVIFCGIGYWFDVRKDMGARPWYYLSGWFVGFFSMLILSHI